MKKKEFDEITKQLKTGEKITIVVRGNNGNYIKEGKFRKVEHNHLYLDKGISHAYCPTLVLLMGSITAYQRIISIKRKG
jgi:hypothetical protein